MIHPDRLNSYRAHVQERGAQLERVSKGVKPKLEDNYRADPKVKDPWAERAKLATRGSYSQKGKGTTFSNAGAPTRQEVIEAPVEFAKAVSAWRRDAGLTKREAGAELGIGGEVAFSSLEKPKKRRIPKSEFDRICAVIGFVEAEE